MEKVLYLLNAGGGTSEDSLREQLVDDVGPRLLIIGAHQVQVNALDSGVESAAEARLRSGTGPAQMRSSRSGRLGQHPVASPVRRGAA